AALVATAATLRGEPVPAASLRDYVTLTKPRIMSLLLITGASGMIVGARGFPSAWLFAVAMTGLALACGGASALNHVLDRDIDRHMRRTDRRPVAADRVVPTRALEFGLALSALVRGAFAPRLRAVRRALPLARHLLYVCLHPLSLTLSAPQHRHRGRGR